MGAGQLVYAVGEFCGVDLEEIAGADGVLEHFLKIGRGDAATDVDSGKLSTATGQTVDDRPELNVWWCIQARIAIGLQVTPRRDNREICTLYWQRRHWQWPRHSLRAGAGG